MVVKSENCLAMRLITFKDKSATQPTSAIRAPQASIEVLNHVKALNEELNDAHNPHNDPNLQIDFNFRIGLDTGVVNEGLLRNFR